MSDKKEYQEYLQECLDHVEWFNVKQYTKLYPGMIVKTNRDNYYILGDYTCYTKGTDEVMDSGCGCCSNELSIDKEDSEHIIAYAWLHPSLEQLSFQSTQ